MEYKIQQFFTQFLILFKKKSVCESHAQLWVPPFSDQWSASVTETRLACVAKVSNLSQDCCNKHNFVATGLLLSWQMHVCRNKNILSGQHNFVVTISLSWQAYFCRYKRCALSQQNWCWWQLPTNDSYNMPETEQKQIKSKTKLV